MVALYSGWQGGRVCKFGKQYIGNGGGSARHGTARHSSRLAHCRGHAHDINRDLYYYANPLLSRHLFKFQNNVTAAPARAEAYDI